MSQINQHIPGQWVILSAVANTMDEENLSVKQAMVMIQGFIDEGLLGPALRDSLKRLAEEQDELSFRLMLGEESLRLMELDEQWNPVKRS